MATTDFLGFSQDAAIVLALAGTAVPRATSQEDEAERWLRVMRMHGHVGRTLQAVGVGESPLETAAQPEWVRLLHERDAAEDAVDLVAYTAMEFGRERNAPTVGTVDVLFAVMKIYGKAFDRALYIRGASREDLIAKLADVEVFAEA